MKKSRFTETQIVGILKQYDAGKSSEAICRECKISKATFYSWRKKYVGMETQQEANRTESGARLIVHNSDGKMIGSLLPKRNFYPKTPDMPTSEVGLRMGLLEDVYVVLNGWESGGSSATFSVFINPLTVWMWIGGIVLVLGTLIASWPHPVRRTTSVQAGAGVEAAAAAGD